MKIIDGKRVLYTADDIRAFMRQWPCSGLTDKATWFEFDWQGDLADTNLNEHADGGAVRALIDDARAFLCSTGAVKPEWAL
jgi:hypothetical protein